MNKPLLQRKIQNFINLVEENTTTPLYELTPLQAREVLRNAQKVKTLAPEVKIEEIEIPVDAKHHIMAKIVRPAIKVGELPVIFYIHGGGWVMGDFDTHQRLVSELAVRANAAVVFPIYTPSPEAKYPQPIKELFAALEYVAENGQKHHLDTNRLVVAGDSVGGNMAAVMALMAKEKGFRPKIDFQLLLYPVTSADFENDSYKKFANGPWLTKKAMEWFWDAYAPDKKKRLEIHASPLNAEIEQLTGLPKTLIISDENDVLRDEGEAYGFKLDEAGVEVAVVRFNGTIHDFMMLNALTDTAPTRAAINLAVAKLREVLQS